jgi:hypothetical protein
MYGRMKKMKISFYIPYIGKSIDHKQWIEIRDGYELSLSTRFIYLRADEDSPAFLCIRILGFGIGFTWKHPPELFEEF